MDLQKKFDQVNIVFTLIFASEMVIKVIGYGARYFKDDWNNFDMLIVIISIIGLILSENASSKLGS